jgi:hypothetical protein
MPVRGLKISATKLLAAPARLAGITALEVTGCKRGQLVAIAQLPAMRKVTHVKLWQQRLTADDLAAAFGPKQLGHVVTLDLFGNPLGADGLAALAAHPFPKLRELNLFSTDLDDAAIATLAAAPWLPRLEILDLSCNDDVSVGAEAAIARTATALVEWECGATNKPDDATIAAIAKSPAMRALRRLEVGWLTPASAKAILASKPLAKLAQLQYAPKGGKAADFAAVAARFPRTHETPDFNRFGGSGFTACDVDD